MKLRGKTDIGLHLTIGVNNIQWGRKTIMRSAWVEKVPTGLFRGIGKG